MFDNCAALAEELTELERQLSDPAIHAHQAKARAAGRRHSQLRPIVQTWQELTVAEADLVAANELAEDDASFKGEVTQLQDRIAELSDRLKTLLIPRDPLDEKDAILEIKAGEGGDESALFAGDLLRMYLRYAEKMGWKTEIIESEESSLGGYRDVAVAVKARSNPEAGRAPYAYLKHEAGVHRVQRVPVTESQGRIHTSAAGVLVMPEAEEIDIKINLEDIRVDVFRSSGPGGQSVNTTDSAVRITHLPSGIVVSCQNEKSQLQNREQAMRILRSRLLAEAEAARAAEESASRKSQVRTVDRSERVRTYNFPENRISDHRTGFKAHNLDQVLEGDLVDVIDSLVQAETAARMADANMN
jgi:peptide chain release factor 1